MSFEGGLHRLSERRRKEQHKAKLHEATERLRTAFHERQDSLTQQLLAGPAVQAERLLRGRTTSLEKAAMQLGVDGLTSGVMKRSKHYLQIGERLTRLPASQTHTHSAEQTPNALAADIQSLHTAESTAVRKARFCEDKATTLREEQAQLQLLRRALSQ